MSKVWIAAKCTIAIAVVVGAAALVAKRGLDRDKLADLAAAPVSEPATTGGLAARKPR